MGNKAKIRMSGESLEDILAFPEDHKIIGLRWNDINYMVEFTVEGDSLPPHNEGAEIPPAVLHINVDGNGVRKGKFTYTPNK